MQQDYVGGEGSAETEAFKTATLLALGQAMEAKALYLKDNGERIANICASMAMRLGLTPTEMEEVRNAGLLHDIGMINTTDFVLQKNGPLTDQEREHVRNHTIVGARILEPLSFLGRVGEYTRYHHERLDGSGYPEALRGEEIPLGAQIVGLADSYAALTQKRPFRPALSPRETVETLRGAEGIWFSGRLLDALERALTDATDDFGR